MTKILACTAPAKGHLYPITPVLAELVLRGNDVTVLTLPGSEDAMSPLGIQVMDLPSELAGDGPRDWGRRSKIASLRAAMRALTARIPDEIEAIRSAIVATRPDAVLVDTTTLGAQIYTAASGLPWAAFAPKLLPLPSRDAPPFGPGLFPKAGPLGRIRDSTVQWALTRRWDEVLPQLNHMRQYYGLDVLAHSADYLRQPPLLLNLTAPPFDDLRTDWPASVHQIGPGLWSPNAEYPDWLDKIDRPIALVTCSTEFQDDGRLAQVAMDALADSDLYTVVTSGAIDPEFFAAPRNARVETFLPHHLLLDRAAVVITHGGMGIVQKALAAGVPACVVPFGRSQSEVARRVVGNAAGSWVPKKRLNIANLRAGIDAALACRAGAARVAAGFAAAGGPAHGADLLEQHFARTLPAQRDRTTPSPAKHTERPRAAATPIIEPEPSTALSDADLTDRGC
ncbi:glycosyltransferase [Nocardia arthritidis]|uniref:Glycosyltransferase n=1 Tax=Nocardia arthritidis TaxID=228602 RepID=A0A6G9YNE6_9NOCA|nr:nucleotide disphospho-sugar-binding domain-containing protein [Nocardia arthritidis]QIS14825.1 glycosyltransferase [Nocardia arthritidis]